MGRQYNKLEKRKRRNRCLKRKKLVAKARKPAEPIAAPTAA
jgi:hypothetical protein